MVGHATGTPLRWVLARNTAANWASYLAAGLTTLILTPYIVRGLGPSGYGVWVLLAQLAAYGSILELGVQAALAKQVARARSSGAPSLLAAYASSAAAFYLLVAVLVLGAAVAVRPRIGEWFNLGSADPDTAGTTLMILAAATGLTMLATVFTATLKGCLRFDKLALVLIASHLVRAAGVVLALVYHKGFVGLGLAGLASSAVVLVGAAWLAAREVRPARVLVPHISMESLKNLLGFGVYSLVSLAGWYLAYASDPVIVGRLLGPSELAQLGIGLSVAALVSGVTGAFAQTFMPVASSLQAGGALSRLQAVYLYGTRWCLFLALPSLLIALLWGPAILSAWVGPGLGRPAGLLLGLLLLAHLPAMANSVGFQIGLGSELHPHAALLSVVEGCVKVVLSISLANRFGVSGVVAGTLVASTICNGLAWPALLRARLQVTVLDVATKSVAPAVWPLLPALVAGVFSDRLFGVAATAPPLAGPAVAAMAYFTIVAWANRADLTSLYKVSREGGAAIAKDAGSGAL